MQPIVLARQAFSGQGPSQGPVGNEADALTPRSDDSAIQEL